MFTPEEELAVQVRHIDRVQVYDLDLAKPRENQVLQQLAANATGPNNQHLCFCDLVHGNDGQTSRNRRGRHRI